MKRFIGIFWSCMLFTISVCAQRTGIVFQDRNWADILKIAHIEKKFIFVDAYADYCLPCKVMEKETFSQSHIGAFFNRHFVSYKMDIEAAKNDYLVQIFQLKELPALLFFHPDGTLVVKEIGKQDETSLLQLANQIIGGHSPSMNYNNLIPIENLLQSANQYKMQFGGKQVNWMVKKQVYAQAVQAALARDVARFENGVLSVQKANLPDSDRFVFNLKTFFYQFVEDWEAYYEVTNDYLSGKRKTNPKELNTIAWTYYIYINDFEYLQKAIQWIEQSIQIESEAYNNCTYAALLHKIGARKKSQKVLKKALYLAQTRGSDDHIIQALIKKTTKL